MDCLCKAYNSLPKLLIGQEADPLPSNQDTGRIGIHAPTAGSHLSAQARQVVIPFTLLVLARSGHRWRR